MDFSVFIANLNLIWSFALSLLTSTWTVLTGTSVLIAFFSLWVIRKLLSVLHILKT